MQSETKLSEAPLSRGGSEGPSQLPQALDLLLDSLTARKDGNPGLGVIVGSLN